MLDTPDLHRPAAPRSRPALHPRFGLVLVVNHTCNLRCSYCYAGNKHDTPMSEATGDAALARAVRSVAPGGTLELRFFGGEPLLEGRRISRWIDRAERATNAAGIGLTIDLTTNGTVTTSAAWRVMTNPRVRVAISHDGVPAAHDAHRRTAADAPTSDRVLDTVERMIAAGHDPTVILVVRPDTVDLLSHGIETLWARGVRRVEPSLDLWTSWTDADVTRLERSLIETARLWRTGLPGRGIGWFDEKAAAIASRRTGISTTPTARCGFGAGEVAVAPSGRLYRCERLVGHDGGEGPGRVVGHAVEGDTFLDVAPVEGRGRPGCGGCIARDLCNTDCACSNVLRTGDPRAPDALLCRLNTVCLRETLHVLGLGPDAGGEHDDTHV